LKFKKLLTIGFLIFLNQHRVEKNKENRKLQSEN